MDADAMSNTLNALRQETEAARALLANLQDILGDDEQAQADAVEGETSLHEVMASATKRIMELDVMLFGIEAAREALFARAGRLKLQQGNIRTALCVAMEAANVKKLELPVATVSLRAVPPKAEITDESAVPSKFWKPQDPKLDRKAVLDALKAKEPVPGAILSNGGMTISIKAS